MQLSTFPAESFVVVQKRTVQVKLHVLLVFLALMEMSFLLILQYMVVEVMAVDT